MCTRSDQGASPGVNACVGPFIQLLKFSCLGEPFNSIDENPRHAADPSMSGFRATLPLLFRLQMPLSSQIADYW
jgi:hypothetical protein